MLVPRSIVLLVTTFLVGSVAGAAPHDDAPATESPSQETKTSGQPASGDRELRLQESGESLRLFTPKTPRSAEEETRLDAMAWYLTGRLRHERGDYQKAMEAFERAAQLDPSSQEVLRALIATAIELKQNEKAIEYALKAIELNHDDYALLRMVGTYLAGKGRVPQAIDLLERSAKASTIRKRSSYYVTLMRDLGALYLLNNQNEKAADCYETVFEARVRPGKFNLDSKTREDLAKNRTTSYQRLGQVFVTAKRFKKGIAAYEQALKERKGNAGPVSYDVAQAYLLSGQPDKALKHLQDYFDLQLQSKGAEAYELLAEILQQLDKKDELLPRLEKLAEADQRNSTLQYFLAAQYVKADRLKDAEELYKKTLASSNDLLGHIGLATVYRKQNRAEELLQSLSQVLVSEETSRKFSDAIDAEIEAIVENEKVLVALFEVGQKRIDDKDKGLDFGPSYLLARLAIQAKRTPEVLRFFRNALTKDHPPQRLAVLYEQFGIYLQEQKEYAESVKVFREAIESPTLAPLKSYFVLRLSQGLEWNGETDAALKLVTEARKENDSPRLHLQQGWILYHSERMDEAIQTFEEVVSKYDNHKDGQIREIVRQCRFSLSNVYVQKGNMPKAEAVLEEVLADDPDDPSVNNDLGYLWADQGKNLERAEKMIRKALESDPDNTAYLDSMGWVLFKVGKFQEAVGHLEKAANRSGGEGSGDSVIWEHLGDCYQQLKRLEDARKAWQKTLDLARKEDKPDQKLLDRVEKKLETTSGPPTSSKKGDSAS